MSSPELQRVEPRAHLLLTLGDSALAGLLIDGALGVRAALAGSAAALPLGDVFRRRALPEQVWGLGGEELQRDQVVAGPLGD